MDGQKNGKPYQNGWFGGTTIFGNTHMFQTKISDSQTARVANLVKELMALSPTVSTATIFVGDDGC